MILGDVLPIGLPHIPVVFVCLSTIAQKFFKVVKFTCILFPNSLYTTVISATEPFLVVVAEVCTHLSAFLLHLFYAVSGVHFCWTLA